MNDLKQYIKLAEEKWIDKLYSYCRSLFLDTKIPSHDHTHHLRVWEYSKEILMALNDTHQIDYLLVEGCLIASLYHDTGLTKTLNENHGRESKNICIQYFDHFQLPKPENWEEILVAIENHDDKNYKLSNTDPSSILSILCSADDLDAFGYIGVVRYSEIYLLRGINLTKLPQLVLNNLDKRFSNFEKTYTNFPELRDKHKTRYLITRKFFENMLTEFI